MTPENARPKFRHCILILRQGIIGINWMQNVEIKWYSNQIPWQKDAEHVEFCNDVICSVIPYWGNFEDLQSNRNRGIKS